MKFSTAMLRGFEKVEGHQLNNGRIYDDIDAPKAACAIGAARLGGYPDTSSPLGFLDVWNVGVHELNDDEKLPWEHIYGMAVAAGL